MPKITVAAIVMRKEQMLFLKERGASEWRLPGGPLLDSDESVESAMRRVLKEQYGVRSLLDEPEFVTTAYEFHGDETTTLHNLFAVAPGSKLRPSGGIEQRWLTREEAAAEPLPGWLAEALTAGPDAEELDLGIEALQNLLELAQQGPGAAAGPAGLLLPPGAGPLAVLGQPPDRAQTVASMSAAFAGFANEPEPPPLAPVYVITGPAGAGKTTVALELCRRFPRSAQVDLDALTGLVVGGYVRPGHGEADENQRAEQAKLCHGNAAALTMNFTEAGFTTVIHGVFETRPDLDELLKELYLFDEGFAVHLVTLLPDAATLRARDQGRPEFERMYERSAALRQIFEANGETRGLRLDTSAWSVNQTVDIILQRQAQALIDPDEVENL